MNTPLQGKMVLLEISDDDGANWFALQCLISQGLQLSRTVTTKNTQCGTSVGLGSLDGKIPFEADLNLTPDAAVAGVGTVSLVKLVEWMKAGTLLSVRQQYPADGSGFYRNGKYYITDYNETLPVDNVVTATGNFQLQGDLEIVAPEP